MKTPCPMPVLVMAALSIASCGGGGSSPTAPSSTPQLVVIQVKENSYEPKSVTIQPGDTVRWEMCGSDPTHTVTDAGGAFDSGTAFTAVGRTFERRFETRGLTYNYSCQAHGECCNMKGSIRVGDSAPTPDAGYE